MQPHVIQMRTLSKAFGIAGLRLGVLIGTNDTIKLIQSIEHPYPLNTITLHIAIYMFENQTMTRAFIKQQRQLARKLKDMFHELVADVMVVFPSATNFVLTKGEAAQSLGAYIKDNGFLPRLYDEPEMSEYVRYSIATDEQLDQLFILIKIGGRNMILNKTRNTAETQLSISLADDHRESNIHTGVGFWIIC